MDFQYGDTFENVHMPNFLFRVESVDKEKNKLEVCITGGNDSRWFEDWNLEHTIVGLNRKEYFNFKRELKK